MNYYYCIHHLYSLETDSFHCPLTHAHLINDHFHTTSYAKTNHVFVKDYLVRAQSTKQSIKLFNLQLESRILTVATAGVTFTDPGGKVGSSRRDKVNCSSSTSSGTSSTNIGNVKACDRCVPLNISSRTRNSRMSNGIA